MHKIKTIQKQYLHKIFQNVYRKSFRIFIENLKNCFYKNNTKAKTIFAQNLSEYLYKIFQNVFTKSYELFLQNLSKSIHKKSLKYVFVQNIWIYFHKISTKYYHINITMKIPGVSSGGGQLLPSFWLSFFSFCFLCKLLS